MSEYFLHGGDPSILRRLNSAAILRALRDGGESTLTGLAQQVDLSRPTTEGVLGELAGRGLVAEVAARPGTGLGRPARRYRFRAEAGCALGIEIDVHRVRLLVADLSGQVIGEHHADLDVAGNPTERIAAVRAAVKTCLSRAGVQRRALGAVAAGTPGVVALDGTIVFCTVIPGWEGVNLVREFSRSFSCPVLVDNDANLAALAERWRGAAREVDDVICVRAGPRTGIGALIGGRLHRGRYGAAGEISMLPELRLRDATTTPGAGMEVGPEAAFAALAGIAAVGPELDDAERVLAVAGGDGAEVRAVVERLAARMACGIAAMALALDPEMIVVGGPLIRAGLQPGEDPSRPPERPVDLLIAELRRQVRPLCLSPVRIEASELGDESVSLGALRLALDRIDEDLFRLTPPDSG